MDDLFSWKPYPLSPGYKAHGTSHRAAHSMETKAPTLRDRILALFSDGHQLSADECAAFLNETPFATRPRLTELLVLGRIEESGMTRRNSSGRFANIYRLKKAE